MESVGREAERSRERERTLNAILAEGSFEHAPKIEDFFPTMLFGGTQDDAAWWGMDRLMVIRIVVSVLVALFFALALRNAKVVPGKLQNIGESMLDWVRINISEEILGKEEGRKYLPLIASIFFATIMLNITSIIPVLNISTNARIGMPLVMALVAYVTYCWVGISKYGFFGYIKATTVLPGVPLPIHFLLIPIEFASTFILQPFTLTVRLMANMLSGHMMLALFFGATQYFIIEQSGIWTVAGVGSLLAAVGFTFFELLVIALQAYIFALLTAVYIDKSINAASH